jgi:branched-chain amino acid aminotransferase
VIALCRRHAVPVRLYDFTPHDLYAADEGFVTGTFGGLIPVRAIDGRPITVSAPDGVTLRLDSLYERLKDEDAAADRERAASS